MNRWVLKRNKVQIAAMAQELGISPIKANVLANRGLVNRHDANLFISGNLEDVPSPFLLKDMELALQLVDAAIHSGKKIVIYGDYDVDGVTSTTILTQTVRKLGGTVSYYLPHRQKEGYGLNLEAVETLGNMKTEFLLTCDNGISSIKEIARAKELGMQVVIIDHHEPGFLGSGDTKKDILPEADAIIDHKQQACTYPNQTLCAGALSYLFAKELLTKNNVSDVDFVEELLVFATIATVCDMVDLLGENRVLVQHGLQKIGNTQNIGLQALIHATGLSDKQITAYHLGFVIGPCINATGRLESGEMAVALFCETNPEAAKEKAETLKYLNEERKHMTQEAALLAEEKIEKEQLLENKVLVIYEKEIHESVAGIVAGRIKEKYHRPVVLITGAEDGAKGSGRSVEGFDLFAALYECKELFTKFGGHAMAAGLSLPEENIPELDRMLNASCPLTVEEMTPVLRLDGVLQFVEMDMRLAMELEDLAPFGKANPSPLFVSQNIKIDRIQLMGKNRDMMRLTLLEPKTGKRLSAVSFDGYEKMKKLLKELHTQEECDTIMAGGKCTVPMDFVYQIDINTYNGRSSVQLMVKDFRCSK
ncbi:single-stranded-DNA-specific exonuclease RecJ [Chakrabartyella piscis]|uniref:single-stranded-DNA-specific exonuclease RecJ n=1 Tax=Chakrabartyella piscis TaxID=2918914 RepID=UPI0029588748|nr:single-stranded-DNA-specific exonuclease RecJ [Chakrabartyella piscis]